MRLRIEAILWILRAGAPWRDLPTVFGPWKSVYDRFRAWTENGLWAAILTGLSTPQRDDEYLMIDSTAMRVHASRRQSCWRPSSASDGPLPLQSLDQNSSGL